MNIKSIIAAFALVASTSTVALAEPAVTFRARAQWGVSTDDARPYVRDNRHYDRYDRDDRYDRRDRWQRDRVFVDNTRIGRYSEYVGPIFAQHRRGFGLAPLTEPTRIDNGREDFTIGGHNGAFQVLQLRNVAGRSYIRKVTIEFENNQAQVVQVNRELDGHATIHIDLDGRQRHIKRIFVYGETARGSAYQILAG